MSRRAIAAAGLSALLMLTGCAPTGSQPSSVQSSTQSESVANSSPSSDLPEIEAPASSAVIVSYSWPVTGMGTEDTNTSASVVLENGQVEGNTDLAAGWIQDETGLDIIRLETSEDYPTDYDELVAQADEEQNENFRPELKSLPDLSDVDTVILVTPNWWADLPMPVYSFLEQEDWQGKQIVPVVVHGGSGLSGIVSTLQQYASVDADKALPISRSSLLDEEDTVRTWADSL